MAYKEQQDDNTNTIMSPKNLLPRRRRIKYCGIIVALLLLQVVILVVLALTVFRFRDPNLELDSIAVQSLTRSNSTTNPTPSVNVTLRGEVLVKNQNWGEFKFNQTSVFLSHMIGGAETVGEVILAGKIPGGRVKMRRSKRVEIVLEGKIYDDNIVGVLVLRSHAEMSGKVNMLRLVKKRRTGVLDCNISVDLAKKTIREFDCQ